MNDLSRGKFLGGVAGVAAAAAVPFEVSAASPDKMNIINSRPYDWSTPLNELGSLYTDSRTFFIRSHMGPPGSIDVKAWRLVVEGLVQRPLHLTLAELKQMEKVEVPAVLQCSGNGRYFYGDAYAQASHPAGAQWKYGGVGNARWGGVRVADVLARAGVKSGARWANNFGLDDPVLPTTPKFTRALELAKLMDPDSIFAYEMNGEPLAYYHGYPVRLIVPGWAGDHWVKWFSHMTIASEPTKNFWFTAGYRYPNILGKPGVGVKPEIEHPVTTLNVKSIIVSPTDGGKVIAGKASTVQGVAWSGDGAHVTRVEVSVDGGKTWRDGQLGESPGKYSWRTFTYRWSPAVGSVQIMARATDDRGASQPRISPWNPGGYLWNAVQTVQLEVGHA